MRPPTSRRSRLAPLVVVVGVVTSGFGLYRVLSSDGDSEGSTGSTDPRPPASAIVAAQCENTTTGYTLDYPDDWYTQPDRDGSACALFDPEPFEAPSGPGTIVEVAVRVLDVGLPIAELQADDEARRDPDLAYDRTDTTVGGRPAVRELVTAKDTGSVIAYTYLVDLGDHTLSVAVQGLYADDFDGARQVVDLIAESLVFA